jgi:hypothetical protein
LFDIDAPIDSIACDVTGAMGLAPVGQGAPAGAGAVSLLSDLFGDDGTVAVDEDDTFREPAAECKGANAIRLRGRVQPGSADILAL